MNVTAVDTVLSLLESQPPSIRRRFTIRRDGRDATVHRGGMQIGISELDDGQIGIIYEHALHEVTREQLPPEMAARLVLALVQRERLCRIEVFGE